MRLSSATLFTEADQKYYDGIAIHKSFDEFISYLDRILGAYNLKLNISEDGFHANIKAKSYKFKKIQCPVLFLDFDRDEIRSKGVNELRSQAIAYFTDCQDKCDSLNKKNHK